MDLVYWIISFLTVWVLFSIFSVLMAIAVAAAAENRGRSSVGWFLYGLVVWPAALVHVLVAAPRAAVLEQRALADPRNRKCPFCAEIVKREARVCRHCSRELPDLAPWQR